MSTTPSRAFALEATAFEDEVASMLAIRIPAAALAGLPDEALGDIARRVVTLQGTPAPCRTGTVIAALTWQLIDSVTVAA